MKDLLKVLPLILVAVGCQTTKNSTSDTSIKSNQPVVKLNVESKYKVPLKNKNDFIYLGTYKTSINTIISNYIVKSSIKNSGDFAMVTMIVNYENPAPLENGMLAVSSASVEDLDCKSGKSFRTTAVTKYEEPFANGTPVSRTDFLKLDRAYWITLSDDDSIPMKVIKYVCKGDQSVIAKAESDSLTARKKTQNANIDDLNREVKLSDQQKRMIAVAAEARAKREDSMRAEAADPELRNRSYLAKLKTKIRGNVKLPEGVEGNPASIFRVTQLPSGEIIDVSLLKSSGNTQLDESVERGIRKSSPLPVPEGSAPARIFDITYLPFETASVKK